MKCVISSASRDMVPPKRMNVFERYLSLWVALCMAAGVILGKLLSRRDGDCAVWSGLRRRGAGDALGLPHAHRDTAVV